MLDELPGRLRGNLPTIKQFEAELAAKPSQAP